VKLLPKENINNFDTFEISPSFLVGVEIGEIRKEFPLNSLTLLLIFPLIYSSSITFSLCNVGEIQIVEKEKTYCKKFPDAF
jgi:hypothetical protein